MSIFYSGNYCSPNAYFDEPDSPYGMPKRKKYSCRVHGAVDGTYQTAVNNDDGELVFRHHYCMICYDNFLQKYLDILNEVKEEGGEKNS